MNSLLPDSDKLKKAGKTTRPFRYDLNQIPHDYTVRVTNRFKGLDLVECLKISEQRFVTLYRRQWPKPSQRKRNAGSQSGCLRRLYKWLRKEKHKAKEKGKDKLNAEFQSIERRDKKAFFSEQCKEIGPTWAGSFQSQRKAMPKNAQTTSQLHSSHSLVRSDQISRWVLSDSLRPHELQHVRPPCPSPTPRVH